MAFGQQSTCPVGSGNYFAYGQQTNNGIQHSFAGFVTKLEWQEMVLTNSVDLSLGIVANIPQNLTWDTTVARMAQAGIAQAFAQDDVTNSDQIEVKLAGDYEVEASIGTVGDAADRMIYEAYITVDGVQHSMGMARSYSRGAAYGLGKTSLNFKTSRITMTVGQIVRVVVNPISLAALTSNDRVAVESFVKIKRILAT